MPRCLHIILFIAICYLVRNVTPYDTCMTIPIGSNMCPSGGYWQEHFLIKTRNITINIYDGPTNQIDIMIYSSSNGQQLSLSSMVGDVGNSPSFDGSYVFVPGVARNIRTTICNLTEDDIVPNDIYMPSGTTTSNNCTDDEDIENYSFSAIDDNDIGIIFYNNDNRLPCISSGLYADIIKSGNLLNTDNNMISICGSFEGKSNPVTTTIISPTTTIPPTTTTTITPTTTSDNAWKIISFSLLGVTVMLTAIFMWCACYPCCQKQTPSDEHRPLLWDEHTVPYKHYMDDDD